MFHSPSGHATGKTSIPSLSKYICIYKHIHMYAVQKLNKVDFKQILNLNVCMYVKMDFYIYIACICLSTNRNKLIYVSRTKVFSLLLFHTNIVKKFLKFKFY